MKYATSTVILSVERKPFDFLKGYVDMPKLIEEMSRADYSEEDIKLITGENFLRVYKEVF